MKIGTLTLNLPFNYGNALQMFSLHRYLLEQGYDAEVLSHWYFNNCDEVLFLHHRIRTVKGFVRVLLNGILFFGVWAQYRRESKMIKWLHENIKWSKEKGTSGEFKPGNLPHDIVIVGSDQIWNPIHETSKFFLLPEFPDDIKKIAYAASMGTDEFIVSEVDFFASCLKRFSSISVRESSAVRICEKELGCKASLVCDPTLLHTKEQWCKLLGIKLSQTSSRKLVAYLVTPDYKEKWRELVFLAKKSGMQVHLFVFQWSQKTLRLLLRHPIRAVRCSLESIVRRIIMYCSGVRFHMSATPTEFVQHIADADGVFTDSFHGMMFATIFEKKCNVVIGEHPERQQMSARLRDFAENFGSKEIITPKFDQQAMRQLYVTPKLDEFISFSKMWLQNAIAQ